VTTVVVGLSRGAEPGLPKFMGEPLALTPDLVNLPVALPPNESLGLGPRAPVRLILSRGVFSLITPFGSGSGAQLVSGKRSLGSISLPWKSMIFLPSV
jgi:hypothetical protein